MSTDLLVSTCAEAVPTTPRKRSHDGQFINQSSTTVQSAAESKSSNVTTRQTSPAPSDTSSELTELTSTGHVSPATLRTRPDGSLDAHQSTDVSAKKRKLTFAEREVEKAVRQREKEEKAKQKADERARKEDEKRQKDEDKRKKEEEKEIARRVKEIEKAEKQKIRDTERQEKDAEKAKKEAEKKGKELEKLKREKSQLRIASFFGRPAPQSTPPATPDDASSRASSRRSSIAAIDVAEPVLKLSAAQSANPDFEKYIIPYFVHENTDVAPINRFRAARIADVFDGEQSRHVLGTELTKVEPIRTRFGNPRKRLRTIEPVRSIAERVQAAKLNSKTLAGDYNPLAYVPFKILSFKEDIRPPYVGTYTKRVDARVARRMARRPTYRGRTDTNYDYDSEAEWEEPAADDEEILEDEMSESEDGDEEMQDFLDDDEDHGRRRMFAGEMEPISSGLCFQGEHYNSNGHQMEDYRMDVLHDSTTFPIDPFSTTHWTDIGKVTLSRSKSEASVVGTDQNKQGPSTKSMPPPRIPLATVSTPNTLNSYLTPSDTIVVAQNENVQVAAKQRGRAPNPNKEVKMISAEFMVSFRQAIDGSDLTKAGLIEVLKKQFPKCSKDAIKDTLGVVAVRVGKKEAEKKWALVN